MTVDFVDLGKDITSCCEGKPEEFIKRGLERFIVSGL
jgi:hypothetical protein